MADKVLPSPEVLRQLLRYDPDTGKLFWRERPLGAFVSLRGFKTWNARYAGKEAFTACDGYGYLCGAVNYIVIKAHRVIWAMQMGEWPNHVDHINGIRSDNRFSNLRSVTRQENQRNHKRHKTNSSGHMGVCWHQKAGKWCAYIDAGKRLHLGLFDDLAEAIAERKAAEIRHGFHANHGRV